MADIKIVKDNYNDYITDMNLLELVKGFVGHHKEIYGGYDADGTMVKKYFAEIKREISGDKDPEKVILNFVYSQEMKRAIGFIYAIKMLDSNNSEKWLVANVYIENRFRNLKCGGKKVSEIMYEEFEKDVAERNGRGIEGDVYNRNLPALKFFSARGYHLDSTENKKKPFANSLNELIKHMKKKKNLNWETLKVCKSL